jgi:hypothetical protein
VETDGISDGGKAFTWASLIPEVYVDVISRIPPGTLFVLGLLYAVRPTLWRDLAPWQTTSGASVQPPYALLFILLIGGGYSAGIMLTGFGSVLSRFYSHRQFKAVATAFGKELLGWTWKLAYSLPPPDCWSSVTREQSEVLYRRQHDHLKARSPHAAALLPKMDAEAKLCRNTAAACLSLLILLPAIRWLRYHEFHQMWLLLVLLLGGLVSYLCALHRNHNFIQRQFSYAEEMRQAEG